MKRTLVISAALVCQVASLAIAAPSVVWVEIPGARFSHARELASVGLLPWLGEALDSGDAAPLSTSDRPALRNARDRVAESGSRLVDAGAGLDSFGGDLVLRIDPTLRLSSEWMASDRLPSAELAGSWSGSASWREFRRIAGLDGILRWEEVEEFLCLAPRENRALLALPFSPSHPLWRIRRAYEGDKLFTNAAIYFGIASAADRLFLRLELAGVYEDDLVPWTDELLAHAPPDDPPGAGREGIFFYRRLRSSDGRVYARCDRIIQSLSQEWGDRAWIVVDASESPDPFLVIRTESAEGTPLERLARLLDSIRRSGREGD